MVVARGFPQRKRPDVRFRRRLRWKRLPHRSPNGKNPVHRKNGQQLRVVARRGREPARRGLTRKGDLQIRGQVALIPPTTPAKWG